MAATFFAAIFRLADGRLEVRPAGRFPADFLPAGFLAADLLELFLPGAALRAVFGAGFFLRAGFFFAGVFFFAAMGRPYSKSLAGG